MPAVGRGLAAACPGLCGAQVRPRSGLALRHGITVLNSPGTIDCDYRGEVQVLLVNLGDAAWEIQRGERIAQLVIARVERATLIPALALAATERGAGGFGSTGLGKNPGRAVSAKSAKKSKSSPRSKPRAK